MSWRWQILSWDAHDLTLSPKWLNPASTASSVSLRCGTGWKENRYSLKKACMTLPVTQHMTWSRHYTFTRIRDSFAREHAITGPLGLSISTVFSGSSHSLMCLICSCTRPHRQSTHAALNAIRLCYQKEVPKMLLKVRQKTSCCHMPLQSREEVTAWGSHLFPHHLLPIVDVYGGL